MRSSLLPALGCFLLSLSASRADLKWDKLVQEYQRTPTDGALEAHYTFRNTGQEPVTIKSIKTSCGCTTARLEKKTFAAGEPGEVIVRFIIGDRKGPHHVTASITTAEKPAESTVLDLWVNIHEPVTIAPAFVFWRTGEAATAKTAQFTAEAGQPVHVKSVSSSNPRLIAKLDTVKPGSEYTISVTPADTTQKESAEISVQTDFPADNPRAYTIHARVK